MFKNVILVVVLMLSLVSKTQDVDDWNIVPTSDGDFAYKHQVYWLPYAITLAPDPRWRFGYNHFVTQQIGVSIDMGYGGTVIGNSSFLSAVRADRYHSFEIRPEIKLYLAKENAALSSFYVAGEAFLISVRKEVANSYYHVSRDSRAVVDFDYARMSKKKFGVHAKIGYNKTILGTLFVDGYIGFGGGVRDVRYSEVLNPVEILEYRESEYIDRADLSFATSGIQNIALGLKWGFIW